MSQGSGGSRDFLKRGCTFRISTSKRGWGFRYYFWFSKGDSSLKIDPSGSANAGACHEIFALGLSILKCTYRDANI
jgi:hypothetical protein